MRKIYLIMLVGLAVIAASCADYLDVNENPNEATTVQPQLVMPQALEATATVLNIFNTYGMEVGGYGANAGGYGGFNESVTYAFTSSTFSSLWSYAYDNMEDYQYIIDQTEGDTLNLYYNAVSQIMKAHNYQLLVDTYNSIPYSEALKGSDVLSPVYDDPLVIYADLASQLDDAITKINTAQHLVENGTTVNALGTYDIIFGGEMDEWKKLANTIKLRLLVRANGKITFSNKTFDAVGFLTSDALINPAYTRDVNRQNPAWDTWAFSYTGTAGVKSWMPTTFILTFYNGGKITDTDRGAAIYYKFPSTSTNQLGFESDDVPSCPSGSFWYSGTNRTGSTAGDVVGTLKGPNAGYPLLTAAESYFLQAEANLKSIISTGAVQTLFENGIYASFDYLYQLPDGTYKDGTQLDVMVNSYLANNASNYLVNIGNSNDDEQKLEAIITQKYIALNFVNSHEGWNEYRRTGYPSVRGISATGTFASIASQSTRADKLPTRLLYPASEAAYNATNVPQGISPFTSTIFWAK